MTDAPPELKPLETLTDEEVAVLDPNPGSTGLVVTPYLDSLDAGRGAADGVERTAALRSAYRSLRARGLVDLPETGEPDPATGEAAVQAMVREDVLAPLTLRAAARTVLAVARTTAVGQDFWYAHLVSDVVLVEEVTGEGLHRFALGRATDLPTLLVAAVVHPEAADGTGDEVALPADAGEAAAGRPPVPDELVERLGRAHVRADVVAMVADPDTGRRPERRPDLTGLFTGPGGSWTVVAQPGEGAVARPEHAEALRERVRTIGRDAVAAAAAQAAEPAKQEGRA